MDPWWGAVATAAVVRFVQGLCTVTYAAPDEFWQGPEIGHRIAFDGVGFTTWEWWPESRIRSSIHPLLQAFPFVVLKSLHMSARWIVQLAPRLLHAMFAFIADVAAMHTYSTATRDSSNSRTAFMFHLTNHFSLFAGARSFSNTLEWSLLAVGVAAWTQVLQDYGEGIAKEKPLPSINKKLIVITAACAVYSIVVRPSAVVTWSLVGLATIRFMGLPALARWTPHILRSALPAAALAAASAMSLDRWVYGEWVVPALAFLRFNSTPEMTSLFGVHHCLWYAYAGLPMVAGTLLPWALLGMVYTTSALLTAYLPIVPGVIAALSCIPHKEHRFLLPLLPLLAGYAAEGVAHVQRTRPRFPVRIILQLSAVVNVAVGLYLNLCHQRGPVAMSEFVGSLAERTTAVKHHSTCPMSVHWLTPCHSAPFYSVVHAPIPMTQLDCSPSSRVAGFQGGFRHCVCASSQGKCCSTQELPVLSETELWQREPMALLQALYGNTPTGPSLADAPPYNSSDLTFATRPATWASVTGHAGCKEWGRSESEKAYRQLPSHIVLYDTDASQALVQSWLSQHGYTVVWSHWYSLLPPAWTWRERVAKYDKVARLVQWVGAWTLLEHLEQHADRDATSMLLYAHRCALA